MKSIIIVAALFACSLASAHTYYVQATAYNENASDLNLGTDINQPWATWQKAFRSATAGDTVYFRGGTWYPTEGVHFNPNAGVGYNGTRKNPICYFNYPGETPVLDFINLPVSTVSRSGLNIVTVTHVKFRGFVVSNVRQTTENQWIAGIHFSRNNSSEDSGVISLEQITSTGHGGSGIFIKGYDTLYMSNCDSYNNVDSLSVPSPGNRADGFNISSGGITTDTFRIAYISGCRAWHNSDDGFDIASSKQFQIGHCWSWANGRLTNGDGVGFKWAYSHVRTSYKRRFYNNLSAYNTHDGIGTMNLDDRLYGPVIEHLNNSVYRCESGFFSAPSNFDCNLGFGLDIMRNNMVYNSLSDYFDQTHLFACPSQFPTYTVQENNTWLLAVFKGNYWIYNPTVTVTDADFQSLDSTQLSRPRKADGSLPDISFLHPVAGSDLVDAGLDVGVAFYGSAPDLGAFEYGSLGIEIISPLYGKRFTKGDEILIHARVKEPEDGNNTVSFYLDNKSRKLGEGVKIAPSLWQFSWICDSSGDHNLRAVVIDSKGNSATSSMVRIEILGDEDDTNTETDKTCSVVPNPNDGKFILALNEPIKESSSFYVISMDGQLKAIEEIAQHKLEKELDLTYLPSGVYSLIFENDEINQPCDPLKFIKL